MANQKERLLKHCEKCMIISEKSCKWKACEHLLNGVVMMPRSVEENMLRRQSQRVREKPQYYQSQMFGKKKKITRKELQEQKELILQEPLQSFSKRDTPKRPVASAAGEIKVRWQSLRARSKTQFYDSHMFAQKKEIQERRRVIGLETKRRPSKGTTPSRPVISTVNGIQFRRQSLRARSKTQCYDSQMFSQKKERAEKEKQERTKFIRQGTIHHEGSKGTTPLRRVPFAVDEDQLQTMLEKQSCYVSKKFDENRNGWDNQERMKPSVASRMILRKESSKETQKRAALVLSEINRKLRSTGWKP